MPTTNLSLPLRLPDEQRERYARLATLTTTLANGVLEQYWSTDHLTGIGEFEHQVWKYVDEREASSEFDRYLPSRYKRCLLQKAGITLRSHAAKRDAFRTIQPLLPEHKIRRIDTRRIKEALWDAEEYLSSGATDGLVGQLNAYYDIVVIQTPISTSKTVQRMQWACCRIRRMMASSSDTPMTPRPSPSRSNSTRPIPSNPTQRGTGYGRPTN